MLIAVAELRVLIHFLTIRQTLAQPMQWQSRPVYQTFGSRLN